MTTKARATEPIGSMFDSYAQLASSLIALTGACLLDGELSVRGRAGQIRTEPVGRWLRSLGWVGKERRIPSTLKCSDSEWLTALPLERSDGALLGVFCVQSPAGAPAAGSERIAQEIATRLKPLLNSLHRELAASQSNRSKERTLTERTEELEWLFKVTQKVQGSTDERRVVEELLVAATERLESSLGALCIPDKRIAVEHAAVGSRAEPLRAALEQVRAHLLSWTQRRRRPLVANNAGRSSDKFTPCKILSVPVTLATGRVLGMLAFFRPMDAADYSSRQIFLARHLGKQAATLIEAQFDLMTGLYTRGALEQMHGQISTQGRAGAGSVIYVDVDRMHVVNELHGFEIGNELIVRIADLLGRPLLPQYALAARLSGDRFAVFLPAADARTAAQTASELLSASSRLAIGPVAGAIDVSISCGVADVVDMPQGLARALAAAEIACKLAKDRGRNRVELYACEDSSMMRRRDDVAAVGQLRAALKADRLVLYAQRIAPLRTSSGPGGYEILMRLRNPDGTLVAPGAMIDAAQRYQLLPSIDRWVTEAALRLLTPYRSMLETREIKMSINVSGQSMGDEGFVQHFTESLRAAAMPPGSIVIEITEQAAVKNLARASDLVRRLSSAGCRFALDDFGTGASSLTYLKSLQISHVKIDGSFVRDILTDHRSQATVRGIVELAKGYGIQTVAEYVENQEIAEYVRKLGVNYAQGYAYGKPEPLEPLLRSLSHDESVRLRRAFLEL